MKRTKVKIFIGIILAVIVCAPVVFSFSGCNLLDGFFDELFDGNDIASVRERVEKLRYEMSDTIIYGFKNREVNAIKELYCLKTQELPDIDEQIETTFEFMDGEILSYKVSLSTSYEGYGNNYGTVTDYDFGSDIFIVTETGREYDLFFHVNYISDDEIKGMTTYSVCEDDREYDDYKICRAGYGWSSPYDAECGILSAELIKALGGGEVNAVKELMCAQTLGNPSIDANIQAAFEFFDGNPVFTEREDGLYGYSKSDQDFSCRVLGYERAKSDNGEVEEIWVNILTQTVRTDTGKEYDFDIVAYLRNDKNARYKGISCFTVKDSKTDDDIFVGEWIHE